MKNTEATLIIGIDTGVNTGFAAYDRKEKSLMYVETYKIHRAMQIVKITFELNNNIFVRFEDARLRKWFGNSGREKLQGAGSVKRDAGIWEDFLKENKIPYEAVAPKNNKTKLTPDLFNRLTGWKGRTSEHARDAAMLCFKY